MNIINGYRIDIGPCFLGEILKRRFYDLLYSGFVLVLAPMFGCKSSSIIKEYNLAKSVGIPVRAFTSEIDSRYGQGVIASHNRGLPDIPAVRLSVNPSFVDTLHKNLIPITDSDNPPILFFDETQFIGNKDPTLFPQLVEELIQQGYRVFGAGLGYLFNKERWPINLALLELADSMNDSKIVELYARCTVCERPTRHTMRFVNGQPARYNDPPVVIGAEELYRPRDDEHHVVLGFEEGRRLYLERMRRAGKERYL